THSRWMRPETAPRDGSYFLGLVVMNDGMKTRARLVGRYSGRYRSAPWDFSPHNIYNEGLLGWAPIPTVDAPFEKIDKACVVDKTATARTSWSMFDERRGRE
ncbi:MAG: hypothetical protein ABF479_06105, partial [Gluconacetobacter sp.]